MSVFEVLRTGTNKGRLGIARRMALATVTVACVAVALVGGASSAYAGGAWSGGGPGDSGSPSTGSIAGGGGSDFKCGSAIGKVPTALYHNENGTWVMWNSGPYPNCVPGNGGGWESMAPGFWRCITGFEVYRFYGKTAAAPPAAVTRSRLNVPEVCKTGGADNYLFASQTSWDANPSSPPGSPDYIPDTRTNTYRTSNGLNGDVGRREPTDQRTGRLTSGQPVRVLGNCATLSHPNPLLAQWDSLSASARQVVRARIGQMYSEAMGGMNVLAAGGPRQTAANIAGVKAVTGGYYYDVAAYKAQVKSGAKQESDPPDRGTYSTSPNTSFFATGWVEETAPCATQWNFAPTIDLTTGAEKNDGSVFGACLIPLTTPGDKKTGGSNATQWAFPALGRGFGERYSSFYDGSTGLAVPTWRAFMQQDYLKRAASGVQNGQGVQLLPLQPYANEPVAGATYAASAPDVNAAAAALSKYALCFEGQAGQPLNTGESGEDTPEAPPDPPKPPATGIPASEMVLKASTPRVLVAGGSAYRSTFTVSSSSAQLHCTGNKPQCTLTKLAYTVNVKPTVGPYRECAPGQTANCDYRVVEKTQGGFGRDAKIVVEFYNATMPKNLIEFSVSGLSAQYRWLYTWTTKIPGYSYSYVDLITGKKKTVTIADDWKTHSEWRYVNFTPSASGAPIQFTYSGGVFRTSYPVIGAVSKPGA